MSDGKRTYTWRHGRQLATVAQNGSTWTNTYDANGMRVSRTDGTATYTYVYNGSQLTQLSIYGETMRFTYDEAGNPMILTHEGVEYYYVTNPQGDVLAIVDATGYPVATYHYDPWGKVLTYTAEGDGFIGCVNPLLYRGYVYDWETGFYLTGTRYYDPEIGRFINADGQLNPQEGMTGYNLFQYCGNNPVNRIDPTGEAWWHWALGAVVVAACAVATVVTCGGFAAAAGAVAAVGSGVAAATTASTIAAGAFIGSATVYGIAVVTAASTSSSVKEFNDKGNWGAVAATAGGAVVGGAGAYLNTKESTSAPSTTKPKVTSTIKNDVIDLPRTGSALKTDPYHAFPNIVDNYAGYATKSPISNGMLYQLQGSLNGTVGRFEWIIQNQQVTHRMFVPGGGINGIPIMP